MPTWLAFWTQPKRRRLIASAREFRYRNLSSLVWFFTRSREWLLEKNYATITASTTHKTKLENKANEEKHQKTNPNDSNVGDNYTKLTVFKTFNMCCENPKNIFILFLLVVYFAKSPQITTWIETIANTSVSRAIYCLERYDFRPTCFDLRNCTNKSI